MGSRLVSAGYDNAMNIYTLYEKLYDTRYTDQTMMSCFIQINVASHLKSSTPPKVANKVASYLFIL
jgi:hypothetical protein